MRLPRDVSGQNLIRLLHRVGYEVTRRSGSHVRLTRKGETEHHITIPLHKVLKVGTLDRILTDVAEHLGVTKEELVQSLWG